MYKSKKENRFYSTFTVSDFDTHQGLSLQISEGCDFDEKSFDKMVSELKKFIVVSKE